MKSAENTVPVDEFKGSSDDESTDSECCLRSELEDSYAAMGDDFDEDWEDARSACSSSNQCSCLARYVDDVNLDAEKERGVHHTPCSPQPIPEESKYTVRKSGHGGREGDL